MDCGSKSFSWRLFSLLNLHLVQPNTCLYWTFFYIINLKIWKPSQMMNKPQKLIKKNCVWSVRITVSDKSFHYVHTQIVMLIANILGIQWIDDIRSHNLSSLFSYKEHGNYCIVHTVCLTYSAYRYILGVVVLVIVWLLDL